MDRSGIGLSCSCKQVPLAFVIFGFRSSLGLIGCGGLLLGGPPEVQGEQSFEDFLAGGWAYCKAEAVVFGEGFEFVEIVAQIEVGPAVGVADGDIEFAVQAAEFEEILIA